MAAVLLAAAAAGADATPPATGIPDGERAPVQLNQRIHFAPGSAALRGEARLIADAVAEILLSHVEISHVEVRGHCDGRERSSALATRRAEVVIAHLVKRGVPRRRLILGAIAPGGPGRAPDAAARVVVFHAGPSVGPSGSGAGEPLDL